MAKNPIHQRKQRYFKLSSEIAQMDNERLHFLFEASEPQAGWGRNHTIDLAGFKVFVKRLPLTEIEHDNLFSTKNLYNLPTYYNYGVGSAGLGVFRELVANVKTTNWVLDGQIETFPLMYHYRILPFSGERANVNMERHQGYVNYWGGNPNIGRYMLDRAGANHELFLFMEYMPHVLGPWLKENPGRVCAVLDDLRATIGFLRKNGIIHFDAHFHNILTDGERPYLTDFGLVLDKRFALMEDEAQFFKANTHYDYGEILSCLGDLCHSAYKALQESDRRQIEKKYGMEDGIPYHQAISLLFHSIEQIHADGILKLNPRYVTCVVKYRGIIALMHDFFLDLTRNDKKDTQFRHAELRRELKETGFL